jgi:two-component system chemotaxis response regulator CheB
MPLNALDNVAVDYTLPVAEIGKLLGRLVREPAPEPPRVAKEEDEKTRHEVRISKEREALEEGIVRFGELSPFTCPECHGVLTLLREDRIVRFRCHTGHAFSSGTLLSAASEDI